MFPLAVTSAAPWVAIELLLVPMVLPEPTTNVAVFEISCPLPLTLPVSLISCIWYCLICVVAISYGLGLPLRPGSTTCSPLTVVTFARPSSASLNMRKLISAS